MRRLDRRARKLREASASAAPSRTPGEVGLMCRDLCIANGLVMRAVRDTMIVAPPLVITHAQIDELVEKARLAWIRPSTSYSARR